MVPPEMRFVSAGGVSVWGIVSAMCGIEGDGSKCAQNNDLQ